MKKNVNKKHSRRNFLSLGFLGGAAFVAKGTDMGVSDEGQEEMVPMLTPDGKLVEVPKSMVTQNTDKQKATGKDVLDWSTTQIKR